MSPPHILNVHTGISVTVTNSHRKWVSGKGGRDKSSLANQRRPKEETKQEWKDCQSTAYGNS